MAAIELVEQIESLNRDDYNIVTALVNRLSSKYDAPSSHLSEDELVEQLADSIKKSDAGKTKSARKISKGMRGVLAKYANPELREKEKGAWERAVVEKYGNA